MMFEEQAVIDCLTDTARYYDMPNADKWTKGIHYGLLHGIDNILDNVKPIDAIPRDQYEARLKADMVAMLTEIQLEIEELDYFDGEEPTNITRELMDEVKSWEYGIKDVSKLIQTIIDKLKGEQKNKS